VPVTYALYRRRRRQAATAPEAQVRLAWQECIEAAQILGVAPWRSETPTEFGRRADRTIGADGFPTLAALVTAAESSADGVTEDEAVTALALSDEVAATIRNLSTRQQRMLVALDPRPPERRQQGARRHRAGPAAAELPAIEIVRMPVSAG